MSSWGNEAAYIRRYLGSGALNTVAGFAVIFLLTWIGASPYAANVGGYLVGLLLGFFISKKLVFRSAGHFTTEGLSYLAAFLCCFALNLVVLRFALDRLGWHALAAQLLAAASYTGVMYLLTRHVVFRAGIARNHHRQNS
ncbi:MAG: hypothetical protein GC139_07940 [Sideroxydans sp.]|nr:hypothetical protein [Sideroxydans sp.]